MRMMVRCNPSMRYFRRRRPARLRAVSSVIAVVLLVAITVVLVSVLALWRPNLPSQTPQVWYAAEGNESEQAWGDPTDCTNTTIYAACDPLPAIFVSVTSFTPSFIALSQLELSFYCNGTDLMNGSLQQLEVVPGPGALFRVLGERPGVQAQPLLIVATGTERAQLRAGREAGRVEPVTQRPAHLP